MMECMARDSSAAIALASVRMAASRSDRKSRPISHYVLSHSGEASVGSTEVMHVVIYTRVKYVLCTW